MKIKPCIEKLAIFCAAAACCAGLAFGTDWLTDGGNNQRTGWNQDEHALTKDNIKNLKLLWKTQTGNDPRALHSLITPLVVDSVPMADGPKQVVYVEGVSDNLYAIDASNGKILWSRHFTYPPPAGRGGAGAFQPPPVSDPKHLGFLQPGGSTDTPVIGPPDASGDRTLYIDDGGGNLHQIDIVSGEDEKPTVAIGHSKFALQLYNNMIIYGAIYTSDNAIVSLDLKDPNAQAVHTVGLGRSGGLWGRRGPVIDSEGTVWTTTGDGNVDTSNPDNLVLANSVVGFHLVDGAWRVKDYFTPPNWAWLWKRDLDPNNTPTIFNYKGKELMAASGKECRVYILDPQNPGGADHHTPLYKTPLFCNVDADFQNAGSWGALSSWEDSDGTRWVIVPFWGPANPAVKFPMTNDPAPVDGGEAAFKLVQNGGDYSLDPVWISRDMHRGEPSIVANGMIFAYGSGENTQQAWPDIGLNFDSTIRAAHSEHSTIYVLDAMNGKVLWSSGDTITSFNHFSGITVANGKVYLGTYDGNLYCFGLQ